MTNDPPAATNLLTMESCEPIFYAHRLERKKKKMKMKEIDL